MTGKIKNIEFLDETPQYVYDISVEDNHNFIANGITVSNCHHLPANTMRDVAMECKNAYYRIGVSATPWRDDNSELLIEAVLSKRKPEYNVTASKLIKLGYLVPCTIYFVPFRKQFKGKNYHQIYDAAITNNEERNKMVASIAIKMRKLKQTTTLILIQKIAQGETILNLLTQKIEQKSFMVSVTDERNGKEVMVRVKNIEFLSGQDDAIKRKAVLQAVKEKKVEILIGSTIADEGLDVPSLDCLILAGGGKSSTRAFQRIGRVLRLYPGKTRAIVFDFDDATEILKRHSKARRKNYASEPEWEIKDFNMSI